MHRLPLFAAALLAAGLALAACDDPPEGAQSGPENAQVNGNATASGADTGQSGTIPVTLQGRWGINAADCTTTLGDDKGLLTIDGQTVKFYRSRATLETVNERSESSIDAAFDFTGEGMTWQRRMVLDAQDDGATLVRHDYGDDAEPGPIRYARCPE